MQEENYAQWEKEIGKRLLKARNKLGKSRATVARELGFKEFSIKNFEKLRPYVSYVFKFSRTYQVDLFYLIYGEQENNSK